MSKKQGEAMGIDFGYKNDVMAVSFARKDGTQRVLRPDEYYVAGNQVIITAPEVLEELKEQ